MPAPAIAVRPPRVVAEGRPRSRIDEDRLCETCGAAFPSTFNLCPHDATPLGARQGNGDPLLGAILGGAYRIVRVMGSGGMGRLYEAEHVRLPRRFAIKVIHEQYASNANAVARFEREARASSQIASDHVVDVLDVLRTPDGRPCIVAERLDGEDLQTRLERVGRLSYEDATTIARQICRGLAAAHAHGVVHRDLKPSNLFLCARADERITVKILDFGVAKLAGAPDITRGGSVVGTPAYMAPEQARCAEVDERVDVYGVGAVLYRMLTGRPPYEGSDPTATVVKVLGESPPSPRSLDPTLPRDVEQLVLRAMARDPERRPQTALELERMLRPWSEPDHESREAALLRAAEAKRTRDVDASTLVLPRGSFVADPAQSRHLAIARRHLRAVAMTSVALALALCVTAGSALGQDPDASVRTFIAALCSLIGVLAYIVIGRAARTELRRARIRSETRQLIRACATGFAVLGALEIVARTFAFVSGDPETSTAAIAVRVLVALAAATYVRLRTDRSVA